MWQIIRDLVAGGVTDLPDHPVPGGGRPARRPDRGARPRPAGGRGHPGELKRLVPGGHIRLRFADPDALEAAARASAGAARDDDALTLQLPDDGGVGSLRACSTASTASVDVAELSLHTPDLDDVFLALTGDPTTKEPLPMSTDLRAHRLGDDAAAPAAHIWRYPSLTLMLAGLPVVFLLLFVYVFGGTLGAGLGGPPAARRPRRLRRLRHARHPLIAVVVGGAGRRRSRSPRT